MSLGSIAHLQYYFARTGVLDGKGAQLAREGPKKRDSSLRVSIADPAQEYGFPRDSHLGGEIVNSPIDEDVDSQDWDGDEPFMLPPTVSTYAHRTQYVPPPPDLETLRRELQESLGHVLKALGDVQAQQEEKVDVPPPPPLKSDRAIDEEEIVQRSPGRGWHEIQGMHILDVVTLAIKAAKEYYTMHEHPERLSKVKPEKQIREELLGVLDILKRMAARSFAGGMKLEELNVIIGWVRSVQQFLVAEKKVEEQEAKDRASWKWLARDWKGYERLREWEFMKTFIQNEDFPAWTDPAEADVLPTPFLAVMSSGLTLVLLHNRILKKSKRHSEEIKAYHTDTAKPYRAADNLRYWIKAAEIRWETKLDVDVMGVVYNKNQEVWRNLDKAILAWCRTVREEITHFWQQGAVQVSVPVLNF